jgi:hypothetical protein
VRVYVHRLRRKLDEFYAGPGKDQPMRLILPKGGYLLALEPLAMPEPEPEEPEPEPDIEPPCPPPHRAGRCGGWRLPCSPRS